MEIFDMLFDFVYPKKCGICNRIKNNYICENCYKKIFKLEVNKIKIYNNKDYKKYYYIFKYSGIIREKIIQYKFRDKAYLYNMFSEIILKNKKICRFLKSYDIIIPIPAHNLKIKKRGYNQTELIAREICKKLNIHYEDNCLIKIKITKTQSTLNSYERKQNVIGAYKVINNESIQNKKILLFDDIYTTGNTIKECSKVINKCNPKEIGVFTLAKD